MSNPAMAIMCAFEIGVCVLRIMAEFKMQSAQKTKMHKKPQQ
jgi:hypothetical protein